jgi:cell division septum initiation protein DivIVA
VKHLGPVAFGFRPDHFSMSLQQIRTCLPREVREQASMARERERIITDAQAESDALLDFARKEASRLVEEATAEAERLRQQAQLERDQMLAQSEILKIAKAQVAEMKQDAEREAKEMRRGADRYAFDTLHNLEDVVAKVLQTIERGKSSIETEEVPRERVRLG